MSLPAYLNFLLGESIEDPGRTVLYVSNVFWKEGTLHKCQTGSDSFMTRSVVLEVTRGSPVPHVLVAEQVDGPTCGRGCHACCVPSGVLA